MNRHVCTCFRESSAAARAAQPGGVLWSGIVAQDKTGGFQLSEDVLSQSMF